MQKLAWFNMGYVAVPRHMNPFRWPAHRKSVKFNQNTSSSESKTEKTTYGSIMGNELGTPMSEDERLEVVFWLIERLDTLRSSAASRAAIVVSADAVFLAGATFLLDRFLSAGTRYYQLETVVFALSIATSLVLLALSIVYATNAIAFVWKPTRKTVGLRNLPSLLFFHPSDTVRAFKEKDFGNFEEVFRASTKEQIVTYALGELLQITIAHNMRYRSFRRSIRSLLIAIVPFSVCIAMLVIRII